MVSDRGARRRLLKEVGAGGRDDVVGTVVKVGFVKRVVPSCGLKENAGKPSACDVVVLGTSAVAPAELSESPPSAGLT